MLFKKTPVRPLLHALGEKVCVGEYAVTVEHAGPFVPGGGARPEEGLEVFAVRVELVNASHEPSLNYRSNQWKLYDAEGFAFEPVWGPTNRQPRLSEGYLTPGTNVRGWITFHLPAGAVPGRVQFFTGYLSGKAADFALPPPSDA